MAGVDTCTRDLYLIPPIRFQMFPPQHEAIAALAQTVRIARGNNHHCRPQGMSARRRLRRLRCAS